MSCRGSTTQTWQLHHAPRQLHHAAPLPTFLRLDSAPRLLSRPAAGDQYYGSCKERAQGKARCKGVMSSVRLAALSAQLLRHGACLALTRSARGSGAQEAIKMLVL